MKSDSERIARLERENRVFKGFTVLVAVIVLAETISGAPPKPAADEKVHDEVRAKKFVLVDEKNNSIGGWSCVGANEVCFAFGTSSTNCITLKASEAGCFVAVMAGEKLGVSSHASERDCGVYIISGDNQIGVVADNTGQIAVKGLRRTENAALAITVKDAREKPDANTGGASTPRDAGHKKSAIIEINDEAGKTLWSAP